MRHHKTARASKRSNGASYKPVYSTLSWGAICGQIGPDNERTHKMQTKVIETYGIEELEGRANDWRFDENGRIV